MSVTENRSTDTKLNTNQNHGKIPKPNQLKYEGNANFLPNSQHLTY